MPFVLHRKFPRALSLIHNVRHQTQIALHQNIPGLQVSLGGQLQVVALLLLGQRTGKAAGGKLQRVQQAAEHQPDRNQHGYHLGKAYSPLPVRFPESAGQVVCFTGGLGILPPNAQLPKNHPPGPSAQASTQPLASH